MTYEASVEKDPINIAFVPEHLLNEDICMLAVTKRGHLLRHVPDKLKTKKMCMAAIESNAIAICYVPEQTDDLVRLAFGIDVDIICYLSDDLKTYEMCMEAVSKKGYLLHVVPEKLRTYEMCMTAIHSGVTCEILRHVPHKNHTHDLVTAALRVDGFNIRYVIEQEEEFCFIAIERAPRAITYIENPTFDMWKKALSIDGTMLAFCKNNLSENESEELAWIALKQNAHAFGYIHTKTLEMCYYAISNAPTQVSYVPDEYEEIKWLALKQSPSNIVYIHNPTIDMCIYALNDNIKALKRTRFRLPDKVKNVLLEMYPDLIVFGY